MVGGKLNDSGGDIENIEIFEMQDFEMEKSKPQKKNSLKSSIKGSFAKKKEEGKKQIEMDKMNKMHHYVIDDNSDEEEESSQASSTKKAESSSSKAGGNRPAREIVFDEDDM